MQVVRSGPTSTRGQVHLRRGCTPALHRVPCTGSTCVHAPTGCAVASPTRGCPSHASPFTAGCRCKVACSAHLLGRTMPLQIRPLWDTGQLAGTAATQGAAQNPGSPAGSEGQQLTIRAQRQLIEPKHFVEARLALVSPVHPPLPHRTPVAGPRGAHCARPVHLPLESGH